jgi:hypothetical protein
MQLNRHQFQDTANLFRRSPKNKSSPHGAALRITQKSLYVRTTSPWFLFIIYQIYQLMRRRGRPPSAAVEGGATVWIQTHVFEMPAMDSITSLPQA